LLIVVKVITRTELLGLQSSCACLGDEIIGASVNVRERDDIIQLWNKLSHKHEQATVIRKIETLLPNVSFLSVFYKGMLSMTVTIEIHF
jgi:hypothetical protein